MRKIVVSVIFSIIFILKAELPFAQDILKYINPLIGTTNSKMLTRWGAEGGTYPGAVAPFGFVQLTPETRTGNARGYDYHDSLIYHFSCLGHFSGYPGGSGGMLKIMPLAPGHLTNPMNSGRPFSHRDEQAEPGYYRVLFSDNFSLVEVSASVHTGMFRFTFPSGEKPRIFIDLPGKTETENNNFIRGAFNHMVIETNVPFLEKTEVNTGFILSFPETKNQSILLKVSFSGVDFNRSVENISAECPSWDFDSFRQTNQEKWEKQLSVIEVNDPSEERKTIFYTALYHSFLMPWTISDSEGFYRGADQKIHQAKGQNQYGAFSPWDTFRSLHPLLTLLAPDHQNDMVQSALDEFDQAGKLPKGPMTGQHIIPIITDSYVKGIRNFDRNKALQAMLKTLSRNAEHESDFAEYIRQGYVSYDYPESVTKTLEFAYDDWAVAQFAKQVNDTTTYHHYIRQSTGSLRLFDTNSGFFLPRKAEHFILEPEGRGYKEGDKWIYSLFAPHDPVNLVNLSGGSEPFAHRLDSALKARLILFDNEPALHVPYLFNFARRADLTQKWVRSILQNNYSASPGGLPGNDDLGSMSSWYVFSAMGFFPFCPGRPVYELGSPLFHEVTVHLSSGKKWVIRTENNSEKNIFVRQIRLNGKVYPATSLTHSMLVAGGEMTFVLDSIPTSQPAETTFAGRSETVEYTQVRTTKFDFSNKKVAPDQPFSISYTIENKGSAGTAALRLEVDGKLYHSQNIQVEAHSVKTGTMECRLYPIGKRSVSVNGLRAKYITVNDQASSTVRKSKVIDIQCEQLIRKGETGAYSYLVKNFGGRIDTAQISVSLGTKIIARDQIILEPGQQKHMEHKLTATEDGRFVLTAGDVSISVNVYESNIGSEVLHICPVSDLVTDTIPDRSGMGNNGIRKQSGTKEQKFQLPINFGPSSSLNLFKNTITVMAWVNAGQQDDLSDIVSKGDHIVIQQNNHQITFFAGGWGQGDCTVPLPADWQNNWHHVAGVCNGKLLQLYIDGQLVSSTTLDFPSNLFTYSNWTVGGNEEFPGKRLFQGKINHLKIFKEALSGEEIQREMREKD